MSAVLRIGNRKLTAKEVISLAADCQLLPHLLRAMVIDQILAPIEYTQAELETACEQLYRDKQLYSKKQRQVWQQQHGITPEQFQELAIRKLKLDKFKQSTWDSQLESYFLRRKPQLDEALYSLIRTKNGEIAQELYFRIQEGEQSFTELARHYSKGSEAETGGLVGPVALGTLPPKLADKLRSARVGQLFPPFLLTSWFVIVRLEKFIPAQLDHSMRQKLLNELFEEWLQAQITQEVSSVKVEGDESATTPVAMPTPTATVGVTAAQPTAPTPESESPVSEAAAATPPDSPVEAQTRRFPGLRVMPLLTNWYRGRQGQQLAGATLLCLVTLGLGGLYVYTNQQPLSRQASVASTTTALSSAEAFRQAVNYATKAANLVQVARSQTEWEVVASQWQQAIDLMKAVGSDSPQYEVAQQKLGEYQDYLQYAQQKGLASASVYPAETFRQAVNHATTAANLVQVASSQSDWNLVAAHWQQAINLMSVVPNDSDHYSVAQQKAIEYQDYLEYARQNAARSS